MVCLELRLRPRGFSLLDLLAALTLTGIALAACLPALSSLLTRRPLEQECRRLRYKLDELELRSAKTGRDYRVTLSATSYAALRADNDYPLFSRQLPAPLHIDLESGQDASIMFYGGGTADPATIRLGDGRNSCAIAVSLRGRVRFSEGLTDAGL